MALDAVKHDPHTGQFTSGGGGGAPTGKFTASHLDQLRSQMSGIKRIDPSSPSYKKMTAHLDSLNPAQLKQIHEAKIPFLSNLAHNRIIRAANKPPATDAGTSEGARKAAATRASGGGGGDPKAEHRTAHAYHKAQGIAGKEGHGAAAALHQHAFHMHTNINPMVRSKAGEASQKAWAASEKLGYKPPATDAGTSEGARKAAATRAAGGAAPAKKIAESGGQKWISSGGGAYKPIGKFSVHKYEENSEPSLHNMVHHTNSEQEANKKASNLWQKTGIPHITRHTQYLR
jgi:hypothetical protein